MPSKKCLIPTIVVISVVVLVIIVLLSISISSVEENHIAIVFDEWNQSIGNETYNPGIHTIGPTKSFISYPTTLVQLSLTDQNAVICRTKDGMLVTIPIQITYSYDTSRIIELYQHFTDNVDDFLLNISSNTIRDSVNKFGAEELQLNFESVKAELNKNLKDAYDSIYLIFQNIDVTIPELPADYQSMLAVITALNQQIEMRNNTISQLNATLNSRLDLSRLEAQRQITEESAAIKAKTTEILADYDYECTMSKQESLSLKDLVESMKSTEKSTSVQDDNYYKDLAIQKNIDNILAENEDLDVLLGTYEAVIA